MPSSSKTKNGITPAPVPSPRNVVVTLPYTNAPLSPLVPLTPSAPVEEHPDMVVTQRGSPPPLSVLNSSNAPGGAPVRVVASLPSLSSV